VCSARVLGWAPLAGWPGGVEVRAGSGVAARRWLLTMWIRGVLWQASRAGQERTTQPVPRKQRMQRLADTAHTDEPRERLKDFARRVDTWSEKRSNKSFYESWMGT